MRDRLLSLEHRDASGGVLLSQTYRYDAAGNRLQVTETGGEESRYQYDGLHRLVSEQVWQSGQLLDERQYVWDGVSNLVALTHNGMTTDYQYDSGGRLIQKGGEPLFYTPKGQLSEWHSVRGKREYQWDARGRLRQVKAPGVTLAYGYDAADRRIERVHNGSRQQYLLDGVYSHWPQVLAEYGSGGGMTAWHDYGLGRVRRDGHTVLADALGSTRALVDSQGAVSARYRYDAQGQLRESSGSQASQPFRYTGEFWEDGADAYHLRARDYLPELGRFNQRDSWQGNRQRPITLNAYLYGDANPVMNIDPSGNFSLSSLSAGMNALSSFTMHTLSLAGRSLASCVQTMATLSVGLATVNNNKVLCGRAIKGSGVCGIAAWQTAAYTMYKSGLAVSEKQSEKTISWNVYDSMRKYLNKKIFNKSSVGTFIQWHHLVEQNNSFKPKAINSIANVVPIDLMSHRAISGFYSKRYFEVSKDNFVDFRTWLRQCGRGSGSKPSFARHWRAGIEVWSNVTVGYVTAASLRFNPAASAGNFNCAPW